MITYFFVFLKGLGGINGDQASPLPTAVTAGTGKKKPEASKPKKKRRGCCYWFCRCCCPCPPSDNGETSALEKDDDEDKADAKALIKQIKNITGLWDDDPEEVSPFGSSVGSMISRTDQSEVLGTLATPQNKLQHTSPFR